MNTFKGSDYSEKRDRDRLANQLMIVEDIMQDGQWWTLRDLAEKTGFMDASISRYLRYLKEPKFGSYMIEKRASKNKSRGVWEYRMGSYNEQNR